MIQIMLILLILLRWNLMGTLLLPLLPEQEISMDMDEEENAEDMDVDAEGMDVEPGVVDVDVDVEVVEKGEEMAML